MNYKLHYEKLIQKYGQKDKPKGYSERHHILPRSMGGSDDLDNLVYLSARAHFIAHWLLWRIHRNAETGFAFNMMCKGGTRNHKFYKCSIAYEEGKKAHSHALSLNNPMYNPEIAAKISGENHYMKKSEWRKYFSENRLGENNPMFGKENPARHRAVQTPLGAFKSVAAAAKAHGFKSSVSISDKCASTKYPDYFYLDQSNELI